MPSAATLQGILTTGSGPGSTGLELRRARRGERSRGRVVSGRHDQRVEVVQQLGRLPPELSMPSLRRHIVHCRGCQSFIQQRGDHRPILVAMVCEPFAVISGRLDRHDPPVHLQDIPKHRRLGERPDRCPGVRQFFQCRLRCLLHHLIGFSDHEFIEEPKPWRAPGSQRPGRRHAQKTIKEQSEIADLAGHRAGMVQACAHRYDALGAQLAERRLASRHAAIRRRPNKRAAGLRAQGPRHMPMATAAADPLLEPPGVWARFQGLRVGEGSKQANSTVTVFPRITAGPTQGSDQRGVGRGCLDVRIAAIPPPWQTLGRQ